MTPHVREPSTSTTFVYPAELKGSDDDWALIFPDVPEAITGGDSAEEALDNGPDCLLAALEYYVGAGRDIPIPSPVQGNQYEVTVPLVAAAKLALYQAMRESGTTKVALAEKLGLTEGAVRKLLALRHRSHIDSVDRAVKLFGQRLLITAAPAPSTRASRHRA